MPVKRFIISRLPCIATFALLEYYDSLGPVNNFQPYQSQQHQLFLATDLNWSPDWELNVGYGWGFTRSTDNAILKVILGYRFH
jgi:hypothetical protein